MVPIWKVHGLENTEIAEELHVSDRTVRNYIGHLYDSIDVHNRTQAVLWAQAHGIK